MYTFFFGHKVDLPPLSSRSDNVPPVMLCVGLLSMSKENLLVESCPITNREVSLLCFPVSLIRCIFLYGCVQLGLFAPKSEKRKAKA